MLIDGTVLTALLTGHEQRPFLARKIQDAPKRDTSLFAIIEATERLATELKVSRATASDALKRFIKSANISTLPFSAAELEMAALLRDEHCERLTNTDCMNVALAQKYRMPILTLNPAIAQTSVRIS